MTSLVIVVIGILWFEHLAVKDGVRGLRRSLRVGSGAVVSIALAAVVAAPVGAVQSPSPLAGLPDLVSDEPFIWFTKNVEDADGELRKVLAFDGYIHNVGEGMLDIFGNPQIPGDVQQRVYDGQKWETVGSPTVRFETNDGHNHFHLISAIEYALWDEARTAEVDPASKIGFCLIDTERLEDISVAFYEIDAYDYCNTDDPDATELRMGITPGWRDTYEATVNLQWVDVSAVAPGRYWVSALTDPNDEILESNENNALVFSQNKFSVSGYRARDLPLQQADTAITLKANAYGTVGDLAFVVVDGPENGRLDIPSGVDLYEPTINYRPNPGFAGTDSFSYYAHDINDMFPLNPEIVTVTVNVDGDEDVDDADSAVSENPAIDWPTDPVDSIMFEPVSFALETTNGTVDSVSWYASGLPPGLRIDRGTGLVTGSATVAGTFVSTVSAVTGDDTDQGVIEFRIAPVEEFPPPLQNINDFSTSTDEDLRIWFGFGAGVSRFEGSGFPEGISVVENNPLIAGRPEEIGEFNIEVRKFVDDELVDEIGFVWTVRPAPIPAFVV